MLGRALFWSTLALIFATGIVQADPHPVGFSNHPFNPPEQQPVTEDGVTTFHLDPEVCSTVDYGDGRGENDCNGGNQRSVLRWGENYALGEAVEYRFDVRIDPSIAYDGFANQSAAGIYPESIDSHLRIASWEGPLLRNFIYMLKVSTKHGIDFLGQQCQAPEDFGKWVTFSLKSLWTKDARGWVKVTCDDKLVYVDEGVATNQAPHCYPSNECEPWVPKDPTSFNFLLGPVMMGFGPDWRVIPGATSKFDSIQAGGITVQVRNPSVSTGAKLYEAEDSATIQQLQTRLLELGCDPGPADGISGAKTRLAAISCREFPEGTLPRKLTLATADAFLAAYSSPEASSLPPGKAPATEGGLTPVRYEVNAAEEGAMRTGRDIEANSNIMAKVKGAKKGEDTLFFILIGTFDYTNSVFSHLEFIIQDAIDDKVAQVVRDCGAAIEVFPDQSRHAKLRLTRIEGTKYVGPKHADCLIEALPRSQAAQVRFLLDDFRDIAIGMVNSKAIQSVRHEGVAIFLRRVAAGDITISRAE